MNRIQLRGTVALVGAGPGDPGLLTLRGRQRIEEADAVVYDYLVSEGVRSFIGPAAECYFVGKQAGKCAMVQPEINALLVQLAQAGKRVVRLKGGDPFLFGRGGEECSALQAAGVPFEIVPGVNSAFAAPAYAGIPVTDRRYASSVTVATGHGQIGDEGPVAWKNLSLQGNTLVVLMGMRKARDIALELLSGGENSPKTPVAVVVHGTLGSQSVRRLTLGALASTEEVFEAPGVLVIGDVVDLRDSLKWCDQRPLAGVRVWNTRPVGKERRLTALLQARGADVLHVPMVSLERAERTLLAQLAEMAKGATTIALTSSYAAQVLLDECPEPPPNVRIAVVGVRTAAVLRRANWPVHLLPEVASASNLAKAILDESEDPSREIVLFPKAETAKSDLGEILRGAGVHVDEVVVYSNRVIAESYSQLQPQNSDVAVVTSDLGAVGWMQREHWAEIPLIAISEGVAAPLREAGRVTRVSDSASDSSLVAEIERWAVEGIGGRN